MKNSPTKWTALAAGMAASVACGGAAQAQSVDALLDKLVEKNIITASEAKQLREETDKNFTKAYQVKSGMPDWVTALKINGDFRARMEDFYFDAPAAPDRLRFRYRIRVGATAVMADNFEAGFRLTSSDPTGTFGGDPISGNTTFQNDAAKKFVYIDLAYGKWTELNNRHFLNSTTVGKMESPFVFSSMVFDHDYTPEGLANNFTYRLNDRHALKLNLGAFVLDEAADSSADPWYWGAQLRWDATWSPKLQSSMGLAGLMIQQDQSLTNTAVPNVNFGNSRGPFDGNLLYNYNPIIADASLIYTLDSFPAYSGTFPVRLFGEFMDNPAAPSGQNQGYLAGIAFGKAGKKGTWSVEFQYRHLESDAWYEEVIESDFGAYRPIYDAAFAKNNWGMASLNPSAYGPAGPNYGAGTNVKGIAVKGSYAPFDGILLQISYFLTEEIAPDYVGASTSGSRTGRLQVDATWKF